MNKWSWEDTFGALIVCLLVIIVSSIVLYGYSSKQHKGYYLNSSRGIHTIVINWENAPDEAAYHTDDAQEVLEVFERLKNMEIKH